MKQPSQAKVVAKNASDGIVYTVKGLNGALLGDGFLVPVGQYTTGSLQVLNGNGTANLSTGAVSIVASNDPEGAISAALPTPISKSEAGLTAAFLLEHAYIGAEITTVQSGVSLDLYLYLRNGLPQLTA